MSSNKSLSADSISLQGASCNGLTQVNTRMKAAECFASARPGWPLWSCSSFQTAALASPTAARSGISRPRHPSKESSRHENERQRNLDTTGASQVELMVKNILASAGDVRDASLVPGLGRSPGEGRGNPLRYSCLENPLDRGA